MVFVSLLEYFEVGEIGMLKSFNSMVQFVEEDSIL